MKEALESRFLPEFLNRIDEVIIFHPLDRAQIRKIVDLQIERLQQQLEQANLQLEVTDEARDAIADRGYDPTYGARPLKRVIQQQIQNPLATEILKGEFPEGSVVRVDFRDGEFTFERAREPAGEPAGDSLTAFHQATPDLLALDLQVLNHLFTAGCQPAHAFGNTRLFRRRRFLELALEDDKLLAAMAAALNLLLAVADSTHGLRLQSGGWLGCRRTSARRVRLIEEAHRNGSEAMRQRVGPPERNQNRVAACITSLQYRT